MQGLLLALTLLSPITAAASSLAGLWTTVPAVSVPLHDALRVSNETVTCEHGGYSNLSILSCPWKAGAIRLSPEGHVYLNLESGQVEGELNLNSGNCSWTDGPPGHYWTGASKYPPKYEIRCDEIRFSDHTRWVRLREVGTVHIVHMSHLDVGYTGSIAYTLNSYFSEYFPRAIAVQKELRERGRSERLRYASDSCTHSYTRSMHRKQYPDMT